MARIYMTGYAGSTRTESSLLAWTVWQRFDPEFRRRLKALMDASIDAGHPVGIGGGWRSTEAQRNLFLSRYHKEDDRDLTGSVYWNQQWWEKNDGAAPAAPPGVSYHESTTRDGLCLAVDMIGDLTWMTANCGKFGLIHFGNINGEKWHLQPAEIPHSRRNYSASLHEPLPVWPMSSVAPTPPSPPKPIVVVPQPTIRLREPYQSGKNVASLQQVMTFWGWYKSAVDGWAGPKTIEAIKAMQKTLRLTQDGVYGTITAAAYKKFAEQMAEIAN